MSTYKKGINMGGHWMHYHLNGVNKGRQRDIGNMDARFQTIWIRGSCVIKDFLQCAQSKHGIQGNMQKKANIPQKNNCHQPAANKGRPDRLYITRRCMGHRK